jgi:hypothetical protein
MFIVEWLLNVSAGSICSNTFCPRSIFICSVWSEKKRCLFPHRLQCYLIALFNEEAGVFTVIFDLNLEM